MVLYFLHLQTMKYESIPNSTIFVSTQRRSRQTKKSLIIERLLGVNSNMVFQIIKVDAF